MTTGKPWTWLVAVAVASCRCSGPVEPPAGECLSALDCPPGKVCGGGGVCELPAGCASDADCLPDERCRAVDGSCRLRPGFGRECELDGDCYPGFFCALGRCRDSGEAWVCSQAVDCPEGMRCDRRHFYCIEEVPCSLGEHFSEVTCDPDQVCDPTSMACLANGPGECTPDDQVDTCGPDELCDSSGRCVQCVVDTHCGPGLRCNARAGRCESEDLCRSNDDCPSALECDPTVALCRLPLPRCDSDLDCALSELCNHVTGHCEARAGKCEEDRLEENDSPAGAFLIEPGDELLVVDEMQLCPDDDDYFALDLATGEQVTARVIDTLASARVELTLVAADGVTTLRYAEALPRGDGSVSFSVVEAGRYFLRLVSLTSPSPYRLEVNVAPGAPCLPDVLEGAGDNNVIERAVSLVASEYPGLSLCAGDVDHYLLQLAPGEAVRVVLAAEPPLDPDIEFVDRNGGRAAGACHRRWWPGGAVLPQRRVTGGGAEDLGVQRRACELHPLVGGPPCLQLCGRLS